MNIALPSMTQDNTRKPGPQAGEPTGPTETAEAARARRAGVILRYLCLLTAVANVGGNVLLMGLYEPLFQLLHVPMPTDLHMFYCVCGFSLAAGVLALAVFWRPRHAVPLLSVGIVGKGLFALLTLGFHAGDAVSWPWLVFAAWDGLFVMVFFLYLIHLSRSDLMYLNAGTVLCGSNTQPTKKALLLCYSLTGNTKRALDQVRCGLEANGYTCEIAAIQPVDTELFRFPFVSFWNFMRIVFAAILRYPTQIKPLALPAHGDYDLVVCGCQTWMLGMPAPMEAVFLNPDNHHIFRDRDVALVNVSRGLWRRSQAMLANWVEQAGGTVVGASGHTNPGPEPMRLLSLVAFLGTGKERHPRWLGRLLPEQFVGDMDCEHLRRFGAQLATRREPAAVNAQPVYWPIPSASAPNVAANAPVKAPPVKPVDKPVASNREAN